MRAYFTLGTLLLSLLLPSLTTAQTGDVPPAGVGLYCPAITQNLQFKDCDSGNPSPSCKRYVTGTQVTELQKFLVDYYDLDYANNVSGFFGTRTLQNVQRFQKDNNLTPPAGYVGPMTRAKIQSLCTGTNTSPNTPPQNQSCTTPWGTTVAHNNSVGAYQSHFVPAGQSCQFESRICTNGTLSGSYQYHFCSTVVPQCTPLSPQTQALSCPTGQTGSITQTRYSTCATPSSVPTWGEWTTTSNTCSTTSGQLSCATPWGTTITHNSSVLAYQSPDGSGIGCVSQQRMCTNGSLSGNYQYASCTQYPSTTYSWETGAWGSCTTDQQTRTVQCKSNTGAVVADWYCAGTKPDMTKSCTMPPASPPPTNASASSCTYKDQTYAEGHVVNVLPAYGGVKCDNGTWLIQWLSFGPAGSTDICESRTTVRTDFGCGPFTGSTGTGNFPWASNKALLRVQSYHGTAPFSMNLRVSCAHETSYVMNPCSNNGAYTIAWGDGSSDSASIIDQFNAQKSHTYSTPGSYTITVTADGVQNIVPGTARIRVDAPVVSADNKSQLASAYTALETTLKKILELLK